MRPPWYVSLLLMIALVGVGAGPVMAAPNDDDDEVGEIPPELQDPRPEPRGRSGREKPRREESRRPAPAAEPRKAPPKVESRARPRPAPRPEPRPEPRPTLPPAKPPRVTLILDVAEKEQVVLSRVLDAVRQALREDARLKFVALQALLEQPRGSLKRIDQAIDLVEKAQEDLNNLEHAKAVERLEKAVELFEYSFLGLIRIKPKTQPLADALRLLAIAYFQDGQAKKAQEAIQRLLVLEPKTAFDPNVFPKAMAQLVDDERLMFDEFGSSTVEITTDPPGARVYLNAKRVGRGPVELQGVRRGFHYLTARLPGYRTTTMGLEVDPPKLARITVKLRRFKRDPVPDMARAFLEMGQATPGPALNALASRLRVDVIVIGKAAADQDQGKVTLHVYDFRLKSLLKGPVTTTVSQDFPKEKVDEAVKTLFADVPLDGRRPEPPPVVEKPRHRSFQELWTSFRESRGFWPTVGVVAGVVVTGMVVGLAVGLQPRGEIEPRGWRHVVLGHTVRF